MSDCMHFPDTVEEFMEQYKMTDTEQVYSNCTEYVPIFRMEQWFEHEKTQLSPQGTTSDLISRQEAIDYCCQLINVEHQQGSDEMNYGHERVNQTETILHHLEIMPSAKPESQWIPCSERLPDEDYWTGANFQYSADVLMTVYNAEDEETIIDYGHTVDGNWYSDITDCFVPSGWEVVAWMPLPKPWEGEPNE